MQELIEKLKSQHGLSNDQATGVLNTITEFIKEKFPMIGGAVDNLFPQQSGSGSTPAGDTGTTEGPASKGGSFTDDIPGEAEHLKSGGMPGGK